MSKYSDIYTSNGKIVLPALSPVNYVDFDFGNKVYDYLKIYSISSHINVSINNSTKDIASDIFGEPFILENFAISKVRITFPWAVLVTQSLITQYPAKYTQAMLNTYYSDNNSDYCQMYLCR